MRRMPVLVALILAGPLASPVAAAPGLRLSWDHCYSDGQVVNKAFACNTNAGSDLLDLSFESPVAASDRIGIELTVHLTSSDGTLPAWWHVTGGGGCRTLSITQQLADANSLGCEQPLPDLGGAGGIASDLSQLAISPTVWRLRAAEAVPPPNVFSVGPGRETLAMQMIIRHTRTVGSGACGGCLTPICIGFASANITEATNTSPILITAGGPNSGGGPANVTWQGAYTEHYTSNAPAFADFSCLPTGPVPVRATTWGAIKSLYR